MKCEHVENKLPFYVEGDLDAVDRAGIDAHLATCDACRTSLAAYAQLESFLSDRRTLVPPASRTAARVAGRLGFGKRRKVLRALVSMPALLSAAFVATGVLLIVVGNPFRILLDRFTSAPRLHATGWSEAITRQVVALEHANEYVLLGVYLGVFAVIMLTGSWMVLRHVREQ